VTTSDLGDGNQTMTLLTQRLQEPPNLDIVYEHLGYSLDLIAMALREIGEPPHQDHWREWFRRMSIIEVFWGQARLLIEFFEGSLGRKTTTTAAAFTKTNLKYSFDFGDKDIDAMMNNQIAHMNAARTTDPNKKLKADDMWRVARALEREVKRFVADLTDESKKAWGIRITGFQSINADVIYNTHVLQACTPGPVGALQTTTSTAIGLGPFGPTGPSGPQR
jgi:hypothetical protein